jgi:putative OPT family oligopeptide transporter
MIPKDKDSLPELTLRGIILGALITVVFTAANVYLGLKVGLTVASSIPAAVISMAVLRYFKNSNIRENNIVQTLASAAGTLSSVIFVLPGLIIVGYWSGFPFWESAGVCAIGGILGVMYTVPLRRAMVVQGDLPYPEGVAAAAVLQVGSGEASADEEAAAAGSGIKDLVVGAIASSAFFTATAMNVFADAKTFWFRLGAGKTGLGTGFSVALLGVGYLVGITVGAAMFAGVLIAWLGAVPILTALHPPPDGADLIAYANADIWRKLVRLIGAGAIAVIAIWTLINLAKPMWNGIKASIAAMSMSRGDESGLPRIERDIPFHYVVGGSLALLVPLGGLFAVFISGTPLSGQLTLLVVVCTLFAALVGFITAAASGYMAGLIGSSNSPVSSLSILSTIAASLLLVGLLGRTDLLDPALRSVAIALALFTTSVVLSIATIANNNLQDLKTGQLVHATPWRQQWALVIGCVVGAAVIPPVLDLLQHAYGFAGAPLDAGMDPNKVLAAPQALLMSTLATGILAGELDWSMLGVGVLVGLGLVIIDEILKRTTKKMRLPPLAVALGIYLPVSATVPVSIGTFVALIADYALSRRARASGQPFEKVAAAPHRRALLLGSGMIVGESRLGVVNALIITLAHGNQSVLAVVGDDFAGTAEWLSTIVFLALCLFSYRWIMGKAEKRAV